MTAPLRLDHYDRFPRGLCDIGPRDIRAIFPNPSLLTIAGRAGAPLFLSLLLHGNETTSFFVLQNLARAFEKELPPRPMLIFIGNVAGAEQGLRVLSGGTDFNRIWAGGDTPEAALAAEVLKAARAARPFASIDIHNNTGANPIYGCVNALEARHLQLAALFSRICVYYTNPKSTQSMAFSTICPAVTCECGRPGEVEGIERATRFVMDALHLDHLDTASRAARDLSLFETKGRIVVDPDTDFEFGAGAAPLLFPADLEKRNFSPLQTGAEIAHARTPENPLRVIDEEGRDLTARFLSYEGGRIALARPATPSMFTSSPSIIRQDCLGYLMEEIALPPSL